MLKLIVPVLLVISLGVAAAPAQAPAPDMTENMPNGRFWSQLNYSQKRVWVLGYSDGIKTAAAFTYGAEPGNKLLVSAILDLQPTGQLSLVELKQLLPFPIQNESLLQQFSSGLFP